MSEAKLYHSAAEIEAVVSGFESCSTPPSAFDHRAHLTVAFSYLHLSKLNITAAAERLRTALYRYLDHNGVDRRKYNETITLFWIRLVRSFLDTAKIGRDVASLANELVETYGHTQLVFAYYSRERLSSDEARAAWIEPDLKPLDF